MLLILIYNFNSFLPNKMEWMYATLIHRVSEIIYSLHETSNWIFFSLCDTEDIALAIFTIQFWWVLVFFELFPFLTPETVFLLCNSPGLILHVKRYCWKHWKMEPSIKSSKKPINQETPICQWYFYKEVIVLTFNLTRSGVTEKKSIQERHMQNCIH